MAKHNIKVNNLAIVSTYKNNVTTKFPTVSSKSDEEA